MYLLERTYHLVHLFWMISNKYDLEILKIVIFVIVKGQKRSEMTATLDFDTLFY